MRCISGCLGSASRVALSAVASIGLSLGVVAFVPSVASAENPSDLLPELADDGIYIAPSRVSEADPSTFSVVIDQARADGVSMAVLYPADPQPNTSAFARRIQEASMLDAVLVFGPDETLGTFVSEDYQDGAIRAAAASRAEVTPAAQATAFLTGLLEEPVRERPPIVNDLVRWIVILVAALVAAAVGEQMIRQFKKSRKRQQLRAQQDA